MSGHSGDWARGRNRPEGSAAVRGKEKLIAAGAELLGYALDLGPKDGRVCPTRCSPAQGAEVFGYGVLLGPKVDVPGAITLKKSEDVLKSLGGYVPDLTNKIPRLGSGTEKRVTGPFVHSREGRSSAGWKGGGFLLVLAILAGCSTPRGR